MDKSFHNLFDPQAIEYARYRPGYPPELFQFIAGIVPSKNAAWDAGCGSGQAAWSLANIFSNVLATDSSQAQLDQAKPHPNITYTCAPAEEKLLPDKCLDLITAANAIHWFDIHAFNREAWRVLKPGGIIAVWAYGWLQSDDLMKVIEPFYKKMKPYWPPPTEYVAQEYKTLPFPFAELPPPDDFSLKENWTIKQILGFYSSWSAVINYQNDKGEDPIAQLADKLAAIGATEKKSYTVTLPLYLRVGFRNEL